MLSSAFLHSPYSSSGKLSTQNTHCVEQLYAATKAYSRPGKLSTQNTAWSSTMAPAAAMASLPRGPS